MELFNSWIKKELLLSVVYVHILFYVFMAMVLEFAIIFRIAHDLFK